MWRVPDGVVVGVAIWWKVGWSVVSSRVGGHQYGLDVLTCKAASERGQGPGFFWGKLARVSKMGSKVWRSPGLYMPGGTWELLVRRRERARLVDVKARGKKVWGGKNSRRVERE